MKAQLFRNGILASFVATAITLAPAEARAHQSWMDSPNSMHGRAVNPPPDSLGLAGTSSYCLSTPNSTGRPCALDSTGSLSIAVNDFTLRARSAPPGTTGMFFFGQNHVQYPLGDGYLCLNPHPPGIIPLLPGASPNAAGIVRRRLNFQALSGAGLITPGSTWHFQYWFRDTGPSSFNLSDGLSATFAP